MRRNRLASKRLNVRIVAMLNWTNPLTPGIIGGLQHRRQVFLDTKRALLAVYGVAEQGTEDIRFVVCSN
jgi:hypothetical protein